MNLAYSEEIVGSRFSELHSLHSRKHPLLYDRPFLLNLTPVFDKEALHDLTPILGLDVMPTVLFTVLPSSTTADIINIRVPLLRFLSRSPLFLDSS